MADSCHL